MRIAIMGAGAVGGYFGGLLALSGVDVTFIARGEHLRAMQENGLTLETPKGTLHVNNAHFVAEPTEVGDCDVVLFAVKAYDIEAAAAPLKPLVNAGATIISVLNGVDHQDRIGAVLGADRVLGGLAMVSGVISAPGVIRYTSPMSSLRFGEADGSLSYRAVALRDACVAAGFDAAVDSDIRAAQWGKFVALATNAALTCLFRLPVGYIYHDPEIIPMALRGFEEAAAVGRALGIALPTDIAQRGLALHQSFPKTMYASMYHDLAKGRPMELDSLSGYIVRQGRALGVPTPVHEMAYLALKPYMDGTPKPLST
ncbi:ketopantoate reductase family protein [Rhodoferax sp.]|uniref:ketopantoate reductase family protein n=1 Tax=Rhodoferax sp. TaxID=50421 RepID=UPI00284D27E5|nr:ketopantoate reductase family protein [Rhodoferax sp.]MDR3367663.1 ketopantoate reductase family protein [Rhodoferax sp.]